MDHQVRICVIGSGYVGLVAALSFAEMGHRVICVDNNEAKVKLLKEGRAPIFEDHVPDLLRRHLDGGVEFTTDLCRGVKESAAIFIAVGTPQGSSGSADLSYVEAVVSEIAPWVCDYKVLVEKSTVPVYTNEWITQCMLRNGVPHELFDVVSNPEFLREGTAVCDFLHPDRIVVGANNERSADLLQRIYRPLTSGAYYLRQDALPGRLSAEKPATMLLTSAQSAELIKHASNAFLAMKISFINAVANLAETVGGDIEEIATGMGLDSRIGSGFLRAGLGYGGSCFPKDVAAFSWVADQQGIDFRILDEVRKVNARQQDIFFNKVRSALWTLRGKKVAALGLAFKGGTDDIRESPAIDVIRRLLDGGCTVCAYDPAAMDKTSAVLPASDVMQYAASAYEAARGADAVLILTDWPEFAGLDFLKLQQIVRFPIVIDGRNLYRPDVLARQGFTYLSMGRSAAFGVAAGGKQAQSNKIAPALPVGRSDLDWQRISAVAASR
ncbi:MAG TPA: UDP-glucose/GDP-mannose dehydrogenase family protein [Acidobacteriaceae bacterium]|jgi:UDPglucose 6-dehydrogenase|nr:UDP-glucose/GDP-mannose dehydrogenase family protein [Acidobacteriaceae bacterium]